MILAPERRFQDFAEFLDGFIRELNDLSKEGSVVLVEGKRDAGALAALGYSGPTVTVAGIATTAARSKLGRFKRVVILTDLDREGRQLAARYVRFFSQSGVEVSLAQRKRLSAASKGRFLHVENLARFGRVAELIE